MKYALIALVVVALAVAAYYLVSKDATTLETTDNAFSVEDTSALARIIMRDRSDNHVELTRTNSGWLVNGEPADERQVGILLKTLYKIRIKQPVPASARNTVVKDLVTSALEVAIYGKNDKLINNYYVGGTTPDQLGTIMLVKGAEQPYVLHIPGFNGYLNSRYSALLSDWQTLEVFPFTPSQIKRVSILHQDSSKSFSIMSDDNGGYSFMRPGLQQPEELDPYAAKQYLSLFYDVKAVKNASYSNADSLLQQRPRATLDLDVEGGKSIKYAIYELPEGKGNAGPPVALVNLEQPKKSKIMQASRIYNMLPAWEAILK